MKRLRHLRRWPSNLYRWYMTRPLRPGLCAVTKDPDGGDRKWQITVWDDRFSCEGEGKTLRQAVRNTQKSRVLSRATRDALSGLNSGTEDWGR